MSIRTKIARAIIGKSALSKSDFGDWDAFLASIGQKKNPGQIAWNNYTRQRQEYRGTVFACVRKIAPAVAAVPLKLYIPSGNDIRESKRIAVDDDTKAFLLTRRHCKAVMEISEDVEQITDHAALDVFTRAQGSMTQYQLMDRTMVDLCLNGNCYWHPILNETGAFPVMIQFLPPEKTKPEKKDGVVVGYVLKRGGGEKDKHFKLEEVIHFWYPNPFSDCEGFSPVAAGSQWISGEVNIATFQNSTLENMGIPAAIVKIAGRMDPEKFKEFKDDFSKIFGGVAKANKIGFTQGDWDVEKLGQTLQEMGYIEGGKQMREYIANIMQVPISKLTMESSNRAVADVGNTDFQRDTILPNLTLIAEELTESLIPLFPSLEETGAFYMFENNVPEDMRNKMLMRRINRTTGVTTPNEERREDGLEPHESEEADSLAPASALSMGGNPEEQGKRAIDEAIGKIKTEVL